MDIKTLERYKFFSKKIGYTIKVMLETRKCLIINKMITRQIMSNSIFDFFKFLRLYYVCKSQLKNANKSLEKLVTIRMQIKCKILMAQKNERDLKRAIRVEDYMEAARIRDIINLEKQQHEIH